MSKAFTREDSDSPEPPVVPHRAALPAGAINYVTPRGLAALRAELASLGNERHDLDGTSSTADEQRRALEAIDSRRRDLELRLATAIVVAHPADPPDEIRFGAHVRVRSPAGVAREYEIVGVDEANAATGLVAFVAPMARALLGRRVGDIVAVRTPRGEEEVEVLEIAYRPATPAEPAD